MSNKWTTKEIQFLKDNYQIMSAREIAEQIGKSYRSVTSQCEKFGLTKTNKEAKQQGKDGVSIIKTLKSELLQLSPNPYKNRFAKTNKEGDTLVVQFTDWHIGRLVKDEDGAELYNEQIFKNRVEKLLNEILLLLDAYISKGTPIKDVVILSTGDILDGMGIFASQATVSEMSPPFQVMLGVEVIKNFMLALTKRKLQVKFYGVKGNHGEIRGEGGKQKNPEANWDLMLYLILSFWSKTIIKNPNIEVCYSELDYLNLDIQGWKYHIRHIAPMTPDTPSGKAKFLGWAKKHHSKVIVYGHYHHYGITDRSGITIIRGGSMTGADEYSEQLAEESEPIQIIWGVSKNRPTTFMYAIDLGKRKTK